MELLPLFDQPTSRYDVDDVTAGRHRGAETSEEAHEFVKPSKEVLHALILRRLRERGSEGEHVEGLSRALGIRYTTCSARVSELKRLGRIVATDRRVPTSSGCSAAVVVLVELA